MPNEVSLDYLCYLDHKWRYHLRRKYDPWSPQKRKILEDITAIMDEMKNQTKVGIMLYSLFYQQLSKSSGELKAYSLYLRKHK